MYSQPNFLWLRGCLFEKRYRIKHIGLDEFHSVLRGSLYEKPDGLKDRAGQFLSHLDGKKSSGTILSKPRQERKFINEICTIILYALKIYQIPFLNVFEHKTRVK